MSSLSRWWLPGAIAVWVLLWLLGLIGFGLFTEDFCMGDALAAGSGGYRSSVQPWPPSFVCELTGTGGQAVEEVQHPLLGLAIVGWTYVVPVLGMVSTVVAIGRSDLG